MEDLLKECPITHRPFFMTVYHPELGEIPTYGGPFDSYTIPYTDEDGELRCERYDHDAGEWVEGGEPLGCYLTTEQPEDRHLPRFVERAQREAVTDSSPSRGTRRRDYPPLPVSERSR